MGNPGQNAAANHNLVVRQKKARGTQNLAFPFASQFGEEITAWKAQRGAWGLPDHLEYPSPSC